MHDVSKMCLSSAVYVVLCVTCVAGLSCTDDTASERDEEHSPTDVSVLLDHIRMTPDNGVAGAEAFLATQVNDASAQALRQLTDGHLAIALPASWELAHRDLEPFRPDSATFLPRLVKERLGIDVPMDWALYYSSCAYSAHAQRDVFTYYHRLGSDRVYRAPPLGGVPFRGKLERRPYRVADLGLSTLKDTRVFAAGGSVIVRQGKKTLSVDKSVFPAFDRDNLPQYRLVAAIGNHISFIAIFKDLPTSFSLYCVDTRTGQVQWHSTVWSVLPRGDSGVGKPLQQDIYIVRGEGAVAVFGTVTGTWAVFAEVFDLSGTVLCRFSTFWGPGPLSLGRDG